MILETVKKRWTSNSKELMVSDREICFVVKEEIKATIRKGMESNLIYNITFCNPGYAVGDPCQEKTSSGR